MLRGLAAGYSGHVRLERRTLMATLQFTVNGTAQSEALYAVLLGDRGGNWYAVSLGELNFDRGNQGGYLAKIDPRNIERRSLEDYALIGVASSSRGMLMSGYLHGSREVNWTAAAKAIAQLLRPNLPENVPEDVPVNEPLETQIDPQQSELIVSEAIAMADAGCVCEVSEDGAECICPPETQTAPLEAAPQVVDVVGFFAQPEQPPQQGGAIALIPPDAIWPESAIAVRALFEQNPPIEAFPAPGYVFVRAPLGGMDSGEHCLIGIKIQDGEITTLCYGVPGAFATEPPAGLEGYSWRGAGSEGYWTTCIDLRSGEPIDADEP